MRIMIVEDDKMLLESYFEQLTDNGHQVIGFSNASDALIFYRRNASNFDLVVTDLAMPRKSGEGLIFDLAYMNPKQKIAVVTGNAETLNIPDRFSVSVFEKPLGILEIVNLIGFSFTMS